jgi:glycosyltransferase involved in cell wall biosynthesis
VTPENKQLADWIKAAGVKKRCHLLGPRKDIPRVTAALDIACSASSSEGFPNTVGEAMACGVPCAVTDVGDSALIVGNTGRVVPAKDPVALAAACRDLIENGPAARALLGAAARARVADLFSLRGITLRYQTLYEDVAARRVRPCRTPVSRKIEAKQLQR